MAIAFDANSFVGAAQQSTRTVSHTCTGSNLYLLAWVISYDDANDVVTGVTYNGVAMTRLNTAVQSTTARWYLYYLVAPATGANDIVMTASDSTHYLQIMAESLTGVEQVAPEANNTASNTSSASLAVSVTTVAANAWLLGGARTSGGQATAGANTTSRYIGSDTSDQIFEFTSNPIETPASSTLNLTVTSGDNAICAVSLAPSVAVGGAIRYNRTLLGVGQ